MHERVVKIWAAETLLTVQIVEEYREFGRSGPAAWHVLLVAFSIVSK